MHACGFEFLHFMSPFRTGSVVLTRGCEETANAEDSTFSYRAVTEVLGLVRVRPSLVNENLSLSRMSRPIRKQ